MPLKRQYLFLFFIKYQYLRLNEFLSRVFKFVYDYWLSLYLQTKKCFLVFLELVSFVRSALPGQDIAAQTGKKTFFLISQKNMFLTQLFNISS